MCLKLYNRNVRVKGKVLTVSKNRGHEYSRVYVSECENERF